MACKKMLRGWHEDLPCVLGVDSNVELLWNRAEARDAEGEIGFRASGKVDKFLEMASGCRLRPVAPRMEERWVPTHYPRDISREGRHIDCMLVRGIGCGEVQVDAEIRHTINTDHAMLRCTVEVQRTHGGRWKDGRPRWVVDADKLFSPDSWDDVKRMAQTCTAPRRAGKFVDDMETKELIAEAKNQRGVCAKDLWKRIHSMRKNKRRLWKRSRVASILAGNWHAYRELKREASKRNWWGRLLHETSARQVGVDVQKHLEGKIFDPNTDWDGQLRKLVDAIPCPENDFVPITSDEVARALTGMRASSSLGPDKIGVDLLRCLHARCPHELACLFSDVLRTGCLPADWGASLLALLPKTQWPRSVAELRPIAMSSAAFKTLSRVVMERSFDQLRFGCPWSSSGRNRGCADMHGAMSRLRDMVREWRLGVVVVKLDIRGAFDCVHREEVANFLIERSPESAEIFGLIISDVICRLKCSGSWRKPGPPLDDMPADVGCYQDDIFLWGECPRRLAHNVDLIAQELKKLGLSLATEKTGVVASKYYRGRRTIHVAGQDVAFCEPGSSLRILGLDFDFDAPAHQQAKELMSRVWTAFHANKVILCGVGSRKEKAAMVCKLIEGCWSWCAGALHWEKDDLASMNSMQLRILRLCFGCRRGHDEDWVSYNSRSLREIRLWLHSSGGERWSTKILRLQFQLLGHWVRRWEGDSPCLPFFHYNLAYVFGFFEFQYFELLVLVFVSGMVAHKFYDDFLYWRFGTRGGTTIMVSPLVMRTWRIVPRVVVMDGTTLVPHNQVEEATPLGGTARTMDGTQRAMDPAKHPGRLHMGGGAPGVGRLRHLDGMILVGVDIHTGIQLHPLPLVVRDGSGMMEIMVVGVVNLGMQAAVMVGTARTGVMLPLTNKIVSGVRGILYLVVVQINGVPGLKLLVDGVNNGHRLVDKVRNRSAARPPRLRRPREICLAGVLPRLPLARVAGRVLVVSNPLASGKAASGWDANAPALKKGLSGVDKAQYAKPAVGDSDNNGLMGRFAPRLFPVGWTERVMRRSVRVRWAINSVLVVDWAQDGLLSDEDVHYMDEDDEAGFLQMGGYAGLDVDTFSLMELTEDEEALLAELHLPDAVRRNLRETLRTLQRHDAEDQGPEYRWSTAEWVASWDQACADVSRVVRCLRRRLGEEGSVEYWPVVRTPRAAAHRVRSLQWARQWTPVVVQILEALVDCHMVQRVDAIPVQPRPRGGPASRSRSRDSPSASSDGPSMGGRPHRVSRARRRVGAGDSGGRATMDTPVPVADNAPGVVRSSLPASTPGPTEENAVGVDDALPTSSLSTSSVGGAAVGGGSSAEVDPTVRVAEDVDGASLVQRLQPGEARELQRLGVRRDTITALGLFLGELASICDGTHPGSDVVPEDVQWALRVVERALFLSAGTQDFIASILAARLQRGRDACVLPDGDGRGGVVQMAHTFMVGAA
ncbi:unnamed protein product, partial [Symbiodinium microadriaticum]